MLGTFGLFGALGIMIATGIGGWLFDNWMYAGPFVLVGAANLVIWGRGSKPIDDADQ